MDDFEILFMRYTVYKPQSMLAKLVAIIILVPACLAFVDLPFSIVLSSAIILIGFYHIFSYHGNLRDATAIGNALCCWTAFTLTGAVLCLISLIS